MPDWLRSSFPSESDLAPMVIAIRLLMAAIAGIVVAGISHAAHRRRKSDAPLLMATLGLLTVLIAMVTLVIGNNVARAFGLVGALSIVRFRTVVDDTRDTAFVIFAVTVGMAIGAGVWLVPLVGIPLVGMLAIGLDRQSLIPQTLASHLLTVKIGLGRDPEELLNPILDPFLARRTIRSVATTRQGAAIEIVYQVSFRDLGTDTQLPQLIAELNRVDGIQSVELERL
jgi:hypothetical protein